MDFDCRTVNRPKIDPFRKRWFRVSKSLRPAYNCIFLKHNRFFCRGCYQGWSNLEIAFFTDFLNLSIIQHPFIEPFSPNFPNVQSNPADINRKDFLCAYPVLSTSRQLEREDMLRAIVDKMRIAKIQNSFKKTMMRHLQESCKINFGHKGGNVTIKAHHDDVLWFGSKLWLGENFYRNVYGLCPIIKHSNNNIVQINVPCKGINRSIAGFYAEDVDSKRVYLMHRGRVGGGRKGIGKTAFVSWYKGRALNVDERDGRSSKAFLVTSIRDPDIANKVFRFVQNVAHFKLLNGESY